MYVCMYASLSVFIQLNCVNFSATIDVFDIPLQSMLRLESKDDLLNAQEDIIYIINQQKDKLDEMYDLLAFELVPSFVRWDDDDLWLRWW